MELWLVALNSEIPACWRIAGRGATTPVMTVRLSEAASVNKEFATDAVCTDCSSVSSRPCRSGVASVDEVTDPVNRKQSRSP